MNFMIDEFANIPKISNMVPMISELELQHMSKEAGEALVLAGRNMPFITQLKDIDEYVFPEPLPGKKK